MKQVTRRRLLEGAGILGAPLLTWFSKSFASEESHSRAVRAYLPRRSDIIMSSRQYHPQTVEIIHDFGATRCEWMYCNQPKLVADIKNSVGHVGLAAHPTLRIANNAGAAYDADGEVIVAPWMALSRTVWNTTFKEITRQAIASMIISAIDIGANSVQLDDPATNFGLTFFAGGDFSPEAISEFRTYAAHVHISAAAIAELRADDYDIQRWVLRRSPSGAKVDWPVFKKQHGEDDVWRLWMHFLQRHTQSFVAAMRELAHSTGGGVPLSLNVNNPLPIPEKAFLLDQADYLISEIYNLHHARQLIAYNATCAAWSIPFAPSIVPLSRATTRWAIALGYALGANPLVPWDVFVPLRPRYFGTAAEYADLFSFVTKHPDLFESYESITDVVLVFAEGLTTAADVERVMFASVARGLSVRFVVLRKDGSVTGLQAVGQPTALVVAVNVPEDRVRALFPHTTPIVGAEALKTGSMLPSTLRIATPDAQKITAVLRESREHAKLLLHIVDCREAEAPLGREDVIEISLPRRYQSRIAAKNSIGELLRPGRGPQGVPITKKHDGEELILRISLTGIREWGVIALT